MDWQKPTLNLENIRFCRCFTAPDFRNRSSRSTSKITNLDKVQLEPVYKLTGSFFLTTPHRLSILSTLIITVSQQTNGNRLILRNKLSFLGIAIILLTLWLPAPALAQQPPSNGPDIDWRELETDHFIIVYADRVEGLSIITCDCGIEEAEVYEAFIDDIYNELVAVFETELETPINLRLYPTEESYYEVNPLAEQLVGVIAHALNNRQEIAIALPRTEPLSDEEIINNMRHELTHFFGSLLSDGNLTTGFQEGVAQYLEQPTENAAYDPTILQQALEQNRLLTWAQLDQAGQIWRDPQVAYPQALSIAAFLIDVYGFPKFVDLIEAHATEPGYRSALEVTYGKSADELEAEWLSYLPAYFEGRWKINAVYAYDLSRVTELVDKGAYSDAEDELVEIITLLETTNQTETLAQAEALLTRAHQGQAAGMLANEARLALQASDYPLTVSKATESIAAFDALNNRERFPELQTYIQRAEIGQEALAQMEQGAAAIETFQFFEAEREIREATILLQSLDNQAAAQRGEFLLTEITRRQGLLAYAMLFVGGVLLFLNAIRRLVIKFSATPLEVEYS